MKTYSFAPETKTVADRSWESRWKKKFPKANSFIQSPGVIDLPPEPGPDLTMFIQADYAALETSTLAQFGTFEKPLTVDVKALDSWLPEVTLPAPRVTDEKLSGFRVPQKLAMNKLIEKYTQMGTVSLERAARPAPAPRTKSSYLHSVYAPGSLKTTVDEIVELMTPHLATFDAIAFRGSSGAALAYPLSYLTGKPLIHVRKELGHTYSKVEGAYGAKRIAIVDDFVCSGETLRILWQEVLDAYEKDGYAKPVLAHLFLYAERNEASEGSTRGAVGEILEGAEIHIAYDS